MCNVLLEEQEVTKTRKAAIYVRVSTAEQDTDMQEAEWAVRGEPGLGICCVPGQGSEWSEERPTSTEFDVE